MKILIVLAVIALLLTGCTVQAAPQCDCSKYEQEITRLQSELDTLYNLINSNGGSMTSGSGSFSTGGTVKGSGGSGSWSIKIP